MLHPKTSIKHVLALGRKGQFHTIITLCMINLPGGQPPSAGYLTLVPLITNFRNQLFSYASYQADRTVIVTDTFLANLIQLNFSDINNSSSFVHLATPADLPITCNNIKSFMGRLSDHIADPQLWCRLGICWGNLLCWNHTDFQQVPESQCYQEGGRPRRFFLRHQPPHQPRHHPHKAGLAKALIPHHLISFRFNDIRVFVNGLSDKATILLHFPLGQPIIASDQHGKHANDGTERLASGTT